MFPRWNPALFPELFHSWRLLSLEKRHENSCSSRLKASHQDRGTVKSPLNPCRQNLVMLPQAKSQAQPGWKQGWIHLWVGRRENSKTRYLHPSHARPVSTLRVMECNPLLCSDYPVLGGFFDLQQQMDNAAGRQEEGWGALPSIRLRPADLYRGASSADARCCS